MAPPAKRLRRKRFLTKRIERNQKRVRNILLDAKARVDREILKAANDPKTATSAARRDKLYRDIGKEYERFGGEIDDWGRKMVKTTAREGFNFANSDVPPADRIEWDRFSRKHFDDYLAYVHPANAPGLFAAAANLATQDIRFLRGTAVDVFRKASVTGMTMTEIRKELKAKMTDKRPDWKFVDAAGRRWNPDNYFSMLTRTTVARVERDSYVDTLTDEGYDLVMIAGGTPTAPPPDPCWRWYDKIVSISGTNPKYPSLAEAEADGLFHPNCIHYTAAVLPDEVDEFEEKQAESDADRAEAIEKAESEKQKAA